MYNDSDMENHNIHSLEQSDRQCSNIGGLRKPEVKNNIFWPMANKGLLINNNIINYSML